MAVHRKCEVDPGQELQRRPWKEPDNIMRDWARRNMKEITN